MAGQLGFRSFSIHFDGRAATDHVIPASLLIRLILVFLFRSRIITAVGFSTVVSFCLLCVT